MYIAIGVWIISIKLGLWNFVRELYYDAKKIPMERRPSLPLVSWWSVEAGRLPRQTSRYFIVSLWLFVFLSNGIILTSWWKFST